MNKQVIRKIDYILFGWIVKIIYPQYCRPKYGYYLNIKLLINYVVFQKVLRINGNVPWPVHFTSKINHYKNIKKGIMTDPGDSPGIYIQAFNGIEFGYNVEMGPGVKIISSNHDANDISEYENSKPIIIGNNVWIGANVVVLPGVKIGNNVTVGAGSVVVKDLDSNCVAVGNPCKKIKDKPPYKMDIGKIVLNRRNKN